MVVVGGSRVKRQTGIVESRSEFSRLMHEGAKKNDCESKRECGNVNVEMEMEMEMEKENNGDNC